jgi:hypothetical protein
MLGQYERFKTLATPKLTFDCRLRCAKNVAGVSIGRSNVRISDGYSSALFDPRSGKGSLDLHPQHARSFLNTLLRAAAGYLLVSSGNGTVLHAAAIVSKSRAVIFYGSSGAGKTTVCRLSGRRSVISDEHVFVVRGTRGYCVCPAPSWGDVQMRAQPANPVPIAGVYQLVQDSKNYTVALAPAAALAALLSIPSQFLADISLQTALFHWFCDFTARVPCQRLHFRKTPEFWRHISWN